MDPLHARDEQCVVLRLQFGARAQVEDRFDLERLAQRARAGGRDVCGQPRAVEEVGAGHVVGVRGGGVR